MKYRQLGNTGIRASNLAIGTATFGVAPLEEDASNIVGRALELGINIFDTANSYGNQSRFDRPTAPPADQRKSAEEILGKALQGHRNEVIICTKVQEPVTADINGRGLSRFHIMQQVEESLRRLGTDHIDVYYAHTPDPTTPVDQTLRAFDDLVHQGKIRYFALSNRFAWEVVDAFWQADYLGLNPPACHQIAYNLLDRTAERELIPVARRLGISHIVYSALAGGLLANLEVLEREIAGGLRWGGRGRFSEEQIALAEQLNEVSRDTGYKPAHLALAWLISRPTITAAIIGPEAVHELEENAEAADLEIPAEVMNRVDAINRPPPPLPWMRR